MAWCFLTTITHCWEITQKSLIFWLDMFEFSGQILDSLVHIWKILLLALKGDIFVILQTPCYATYYRLRYACSAVQNKDVGWKYGSLEREQLIIVVNVFPSLLYSWCKSKLDHAQWRSSYYKKQNSIRVGNILVIIHYFGKELSIGFHQFNA